MFPTATNCLQSGNYRWYFELLPLYLLLLVARSIAARSCNHCCFFRTDDRSEGGEKSQKDLEDITLYISPATCLMAAKDDHLFELPKLRVSFGFEV